MAPTCAVELTNFLAFVKQLRVYKVFAFTLTLAAVVLGLVFVVFTVVFGRLQP